MSSAPKAAPGQKVVSGPEKHRSELRWNVELADGSRAVLLQLLPEAARDITLRRRYVFEAERLAKLQIPCVAGTLAIGPQPEPRDPDAGPPWRLRQTPSGERLSDVLVKRTVFPVEEALHLAANIADALHTVHSEGVVLRDLEPHSIYVDGDAITFTDFGLARVDILSSHTASSIILQQSAYAAPEHLRKTAIDARADVYTLGVLLWRLLTGALPFGDEALFFRERVALPPLGELAVDIPEGLDSVVQSALAEDPGERPASARAFASMLRGQHQAGARSLARIQCQACLTPMRPGLRLCLSCGKEAVQFARAVEDDATSKALVLSKATEDEEFHGKLRKHFEVLAEEAPEHLNFVVGDRRMYSKSELESRIPVPAVLFDRLEKGTAEALQKRLTADGFKVKLQSTKHPEKIRKRGKRYQMVGGTAMAAGVGMGIALTPWWLLLSGVGLLLVLTGAVVRSHAKQLKKKAVPLAKLRKAPAALPASDPLVARMAGLLSECRDESLREQIAELALLVQRLCDHRAQLKGQSSEAADLAMLTEPIVPLVDLIEKQARTLIAVQSELSELDEGVIVRAIATSEARGEPESKRAPLLQGLDRLRSLEDERSAHLQRLLEAGALLEQVVTMGLEVEDPERVSDNYTRLALAALDD